MFAKHWGTREALARECCRMVGWSDDRTIGNKRISTHVHSHCYHIWTLHKSEAPTVNSYHGLSSNALLIEGLAMGIPQPHISKIKTHSRLSNQSGHQD